MTSTDARFNVVGEDGGTWEVPVPYHRHGIDHNHPAKATSTDTHSHTTGNAGNHNHTTGFNVVTNTTLGGTGQRVYGTGSTDFNTSTDGSHTHTVSSDSHSHTLDLSLIDAWSSYTGTNGVDHVPPYLVISYVIRVD